jgi:hypothetical protein
MWAGGEILNALLKASPYDCVTCARLAELTGIRPRDLDARLEALARLRLARESARGCWRLTSAGRAAASEALRRARLTTRSPLYERTWLALRRQPTTTVPDLIMLVAQGGERAIVARISAYLGALARAGYVRQLPVRARGLRRYSSGHVRWRLLLDTGPRAPVWRRRAGTVYDPNTRAETPLTADFARAPRRAPEREMCDVA